MANNKNLVPFKKGYDQRRENNGRPKGSRSLATILREFEEESFDWSLFPTKGNKGLKELIDTLSPMGSPLRAIAYKAFIDAVSGKGIEKVAAREWIRKAAYGEKLDVTSKGKAMKSATVIDLGNLKDDDTSS